MHAGAHLIDVAAQCSEGVHQVVRQLVCTLVGVPGCLRCTCLPSTGGTAAVSALGAGQGSKGRGESSAMASQLGAGKRCISSLKETISSKRGS